MIKPHPIWGIYNDSRQTVGANLGLVGLTQAGCSRERAPESSAPPNVLIIYVDQMRADCLRASGHPELNTPHPDRLGAEGVFFENAYACYPVCTPSRAAFMTGRYPHSNGACGNHKALDPNPIYLGQALRDRGYSTCYIGKLHLAGGTIPGFVHPRYRCGFEEFVGFNHGHDYFHSIHYRDTDEPLHDAGF